MLDTFGVTTMKRETRNEKRETRNEKRETRDNGVKFENFNCCVTYKILLIVLTKTKGQK